MGYTVSKASKDYFYEETKRCTISIGPSTSTRNVNTPARFGLVLEALNEPQYVQPFQHATRAVLPPLGQDSAYFPLNLGGLRNDQQIIFNIMKNECLLRHPRLSSADADRMTVRGVLDIFRSEEPKLPRESLKKDLESRYEPYTASEIVESARKSLQMTYDNEESWNYSIDGYLSGDGGWLQAMPKNFAFPYDIAKAGENFLKWAAQDENAHNISKPDTLRLYAEDQGDEIPKLREIFGSMVPSPPSTWQSVNRAPKQQQEDYAEPASRDEDAQSSGSHDTVTQQYDVEYPGRRHRDGTVTWQMPEDNRAAPAEQTQQVLPRTPQPAQGALEAGSSQSNPSEPLRGNKHPRGNEGSDQGGKRARASGPQWGR